MQLKEILLQKINDQNPFPSAQTDHIKKHKKTKDRDSSLDQFLTNFTFNHCIASLTELKGRLKLQSTPDV